MRSFQLDQNSNHKQLANQCNAEGRCFVRRLPTELVDEDDGVILPALLAKEATLLTMDFRIVEDNPGCIPPQNPGIVVVLARPNTADLMKRMLARFKSECPEWPDFNWSQIYAEIDEREIYVSKLVDGNTEAGTAIPFGVPGFAGLLADAIAALKPSPPADKLPTSEKPDDNLSN